MAVVNDFADAVAAQAAGYALETWSTNDVSGKGQKQSFITTYHAKLSKLITDEGGSSDLLEAFGESSTDQPTATANCVASLNAIRRERYAGAPGDPSGATVVAAYPDGTVPTVDTN